MPIDPEKRAILVAQGAAEATSAAAAAQAAQAVILFVVSLPVQIAMYEPRPLGVLGLIGIADHLHQTFAVAQIDEDEAAQIATPVHPSAKANGATDILRAQEATGVGTQGRGEHGLIWQRRHYARRSGRGESGKFMGR